MWVGLEKRVECDLDYPPTIGCTATSTADTTGIIPRWREPHLLQSLRTERFKKLKLDHTRVKELTWFIKNTSLNDKLPVMSRHDEWNTYWNQTFSHIHGNIRNRHTYHGNRLHEEKLEDVKTIKIFFAPPAFKMSLYMQFLLSFFISHWLNP